MAGRLDEAERDAAHAQLFAVADGAVRERGCGARAEDDFGSGARRQFPVPAHEVGMEVRLDHVPDLQALLFGQRDVLLDVALRIDDRGLAVRPEQVRGMCETTQIELFEVHSSDNLRVGRRGQLAHVNLSDFGGCLSDCLRLW